MWKYLTLLAVVLVHLAKAQHKHAYHKFPVAAGHETECYDAQQDKYYKIGESWNPINARCKLSRCIKEGNSLFVDRVSCDPVKEVVQKLKATGAFCREAAGDRRKGFPGCCSRPLCKKREGNRLVTLKPEDYPPIEDEISYIDS